MKRTNLSWHDAALYEVCGRVEIEFDGRVLVFKVPQWSPVRSVWKTAAGVLKVELLANSICSLDAEGFQEIK